MIIYMNYLETAYIDLNGNGLGCHITSILIGFEWCIKNNKQFTYKSLPPVHHNHLGSDYNNQIEQLFGLNKIKKYDSNSIKIPYNEIYGSCCPDDDTMKYVKSLFNSDNKYDNTPYDWIIHIRRNDIKTNQHSDRYIEYSKYNEIIELIRHNYKDEIIILSDGDKNEIQKNITDKNILIDTNSNSLQAFCKMVYCKNLVVGWSSFSYSAALYNNNNVYKDILLSQSHNYFHRCPNKWKTLHHIKIPSHCNKLYIDIGLSSEAIQTQSWLENVPDAFCIGFEPSPEARKSIFMECIEADPRWLRKENYDRLHLEKCALSDFVGKATFYRPNIDVGCSSLYKPKAITDPPFKGVKEEYQVDVNTLVNYFSSNPSLLKRFDRIEYIKIDAQGSDLKILKSSRKLLEKVVWITAEGDGGYYVTECNRENECNKYNIINYLTSIGFIQYNHPNTSDPTFYNPKYKDYLDVFINQY